MKEQEIQDILQEAIDLFVEEEGAAVETITFEEAGIFTNDKGLVLTTEDGHEFQITIVRSK